MGYVIHRFVSKTYLLPSVKSFGDDVDELRQTEPVWWGDPAGRKGGVLKEHKKEVDLVRFPNLSSRPLMDIGGGEIGIKVLGGDVTPPSSCSLSECDLFRFIYSFRFGRPWLGVGPCGVDRTLIF